MTTKADSAQVLANLKDAATALDNWGEDETGREVHEGIALIESLTAERDALKAGVERLQDEIKGCVYGPCPTLAKLVFEEMGQSEGDW